MGVSSGLENSTSAWASVFNLGNCAIGAGILSFPYAVQRCGLLGGILMCLLVACVELYTQYVLARQATKHRAITYQGLVMTVLGSRASEVMAWTIFLFLFGSCVAFMIIVGDTFGAVLRQYVIERYHLPPVLAARQIMILLPALTIMLPLSLQRSMGSLAAASTVAVTVMMGTTVIVLGKTMYAAATAIDGEGHTFFSGVTLFKCDFATFAALPVMIFAYHCHVQAVPIYFELVDDPKLCGSGCCGRRQRTRSNDAATDSSGTLVAAQEAQPDSTVVNVIARKLRGMYAVLAAAYAECTVMYLATGVAGYLLFPTTATSNVLNNFSPEDTLMQATRFVVGWAVVLHYPINQHVARSALYDLICRYLNMELREENVPYGHVATMTVLFFVATSTTACAVSDLGIVFQFIGGIAGSLLIFILPGALIIADRRGAAPMPELSERASTSSAAAAPLDAEAPILWGDAPERLAADWRSRQAHLRNGASQRSAPASTSAAPFGTLLGDRPCHESAWDTPAVGWSLVVVGLCVIALTLGTAIAPLLGRSSAEGLHDAFTDSGAASHGRSLQALSVTLAA